jgi:hypothetical protein
MARKFFLPPRDPPSPGRENMIRSSNPRSETYVNLGFCRSA